MPPKAPSTALRAWRCTHRSFSTTTLPLRQQDNHKVGPEHPTYIPIPVPPQQTAPDRKFSKGFLPIPRDVFAGAEGRDKASLEWWDPHTRAPARAKKAQQGSREEWKARVSEQRRRNLREGLLSLKARKERESRLYSERGTRRQQERQEALERPEREDEHLTAPSHGLDLHALLGKHPNGLPDPSREERLARMRANVAAHKSSKAAQRQEAINQLYHHARHFIVNPQQLDAAIDEAFGPDGQPVVFGNTFGGSTEENQSVWVYGKPETVQDMLDRANGVNRGRAFEGAGGYSRINAERIRRIAELFTGGKMENEDARGL